MADGDERRSGADGDERRSGADGSEPRGPPESPERPGVPATKRARARSAALWGLVGGFAFLVLAQGYLLLGGDLPVGLPGSVAIAAAIAVASGGLAYATEHRLPAKRRT